MQQLSFLRAGAPGARLCPRTSRGDQPSTLPLSTVRVPRRVVAWPGKACGHTAPSGESHNVIGGRAGIGPRTWGLGFCGRPQRRRYAVGQGPFDPVLAVRKAAGGRGTRIVERGGLGVEAAETAGTGGGGIRGAGRGRSTVRAGNPRHRTFSTAGGPGPATCWGVHEGSAGPCFTTGSWRGHTRSSQLSGPNGTG